MSAFEPWNEVRANAIIAAEVGRDGATMPILHALQEVFGHIPRQAIPMIASALNLSRAEVYGVVGFYHDFRDAPAGDHIVKLCQAESCQSMGGEALGEFARETLRVDWGGTTLDGSVTLEPVYCLGLCACSPNAMIDGKVHGRLDRHRLGALLDQVKRA